MSELSQLNELEKRHIQKELYSTILVVDELEKKIKAITEKFSMGEFNSRSSFKEAKQAIDKMKELRTEQKKNEKICSNLREKLKQFN